MSTRRVNGNSAGNSSGSQKTTPRLLLNMDPDDPEYIKEMQRPAAIKEDLTEMERRKRVQQILESKSFCRELEELIRQESESARNEGDHLSTLQKLSELTLPSASLPVGGLHNLVPIADLQRDDKYSKAERIARNKLAALYRLVDLFQWSQGIYNHITYRLPSGDDEILINPFGLLYHEITASSLIKTNLAGEVLDAGSTKLGINQAGYVLHSAIHEARPDVRCVVHLHTAVVSAVSSMKCGLLPICQEAMIIGPVAYREYQGILDDEAEKASIVADLGDKNVMLLRNHGFVACGQSIEDALHLVFHTIIACETQVLILQGLGFIACGKTLEEAAFLARNLVLACEHQIRAARAGIENLVIPDQKAVERAYKTARQGGGGVNRSPSRDANGKAIQWEIGELEWEAWMRVLDNAGYRTGHLYKQPLLRTRLSSSFTEKTNSEVAIPPTSSSMGLVDESDPEALTSHKINLLRKEQEKVRWLNSPNNYQKIEVFETGTDRPKVITKWIQDPTSPSHCGTPVKITSPHQFSPFGANPKEFKEKQKAIKENRRSGTTTAGPQSQILDGVSFEEMAKIRDEENGALGPDRVVMIGTASKGIIDRQFQHNAQVYRQLYAPNPFASETDEDIQRYIKEVELKTPRSRSAVDTSLSRHREPSPPPRYFEEEADSPTADTASLMQAAREHRARSFQAGKTSASIDEEGDHISEIPSHFSPTGRLALETTFDSDERPHSRLVPFDELSPTFLYQPRTSTPQPENFSPTTYNELFHGLRSPTTPTSRIASTSVESGLSARSEATTSDDEVTKEGKKKKKKFFFFGRKKKDKFVS